MPLLAGLISSLFTRLFGLATALTAGKLAIRYSVVIALATLYVAAVTLFNGFVSPLLGALFATSYGQVIGLAFPPMAGTVLAGYFGLWSALLSYRYFKRLGQMMIPG